MVDSNLGFSMWLDFVERDYLKNEFPALIEKGIINGATSNPSIFASAITRSPAYREQMERLSGKSPKQKYEALAIEDIKTAAKALRPLYDKGSDGYISIEVDPFLSKDTQGTVEEGKRLFDSIGEPNVMIKVPATDEGYEAMSILLADGISVNATLIFSPDQARGCLDAMKSGIAKCGSKVDGVISVFVSRFDRLLDDKLSKVGIEPSKTGIYNAAKIYNMIEAESIPNIRTLFASTGVKGDNLRADYYIRELLASHSVNTAPLETIESYINTPLSQPNLPISDRDISAYFNKLADVGVDINEIYSLLMSDGLIAFENAFSDMLESLK